MGALFAFLALCVFLYHPAEFEFTFLPLELAAAFAVGVLLVHVGHAHFPQPVLAPLPRRGRRAGQRVPAFTDCGVHKTRGRTGVLVFVSAFERRAVVRPDVGVPAAELATWAEALDSSVGKGPESFLAALREVAPRLAEQLPRAADDSNELPDDVKEAG